MKVAGARAVGSPFVMFLSKFFSKCARDMQSAVWVEWEKSSAKKFDKAKEPYKLE